MWKIEDIETIDIEVTSHCNIKCPLCIRSKKGAEEFSDVGHLSLDLIKEKVTKDIFPNLKALIMCGSSDEPMMNPEIEDWIDWGLNDLDLNKLTISSNASLRTPAWWKSLGERFGKKLHVMFAIDGLDQETNNKYRVGADFNKAINNAKAFIEGGGHAIWQFIVFPHNEHQIEEWEVTAKDIGFHDTRLIYSARNGVKKPEDNMHYKEADVDPESIMKDNIICQYIVKKKIFINHRGRVVPCCYLNYHDLYHHSDYADFIKAEGGILANSLEYNDMLDLFETYLNVLFNNPVRECYRVCQKRGHHNIIMKTNA